MTSSVDNITKDGLIVIIGPTGSGKSAVAMEIAKKRGIAIVSADSRQIYRGMEIGTDAPSLEDRSRVPHFFIGCLSPDSEYSAIDYAREALPVIEREIAQNGSVLVVGGSALYVKSLLYEMDDIPPVPEEIHKRIGTLYAEGGIEAIRDRLKESDPIYLTKVDPNNYRRLMRALEVSMAFGRPFSSFHTSTKRVFSHPVTVIYIERERKDLYDRINRRVEQMIDRGLIKEALKLIPYKDTIALQTIGYQEIFRYLYREQDLDRTVASIQKNTRTFARHQITSFKHYTPNLIIRL